MQKNELGKISKVILDKINLNLQNATRFNQWKNTNVVISWFKSIKNKQNYMLVSFDIKDSYPAVTKELSSKCFNLLKQKYKFQKMIRNNIYFEMITAIWLRKHVDEEKGGSIRCSNGSLLWCWSMQTCWYPFIGKN